MITEESKAVKNKDFPPLPLEEWEATKETLHLYLQVIGKIRLALMPRRNHWWNVTFYITTRGLGTGPIPYKDKTFEIDLDFVDHQLLIRTNEGAVESITLQDGLSVSNFYTSVMKALAIVGVSVEILAKPYYHKSKIPFAEDHEHATYNAEQVNRYWRALVTIDQVMKEFSGRFYGKTSPVHLYWHHMDLVLSRFSGKSIPVPANGSIVEKDAYSHEVISFGFWPGDDKVPYPAFYSYTFPSPGGIELEMLSPKQAQWVNYNGSPMALLNYEELRNMNNPHQVLLSFLESAYIAGAQQADWPVQELRTIPLNEL